jgi:hypothetical protein
MQIRLILESEWLLIDTNFTDMICAKPTATMPARLLSVNTKKMASTAFKISTGLLWHYTEDKQVFQQANFPFYMVAIGKHLLVESLPTCSLHVYHGCLYP